MKEKKFSRKGYEEMLDHHADECEAFYKSPKGQANLRRSKLAGIEIPGVEQIKLFMTSFKKVSGISYNEFLKRRRDEMEKECEKVHKAMEPFARAEGYILPYDIDELAGFYLWLVNTSDTGDVPIGRQLFVEFDNYRRQELERMKRERNRPSGETEITLDSLGKEESEVFLDPKVLRSFLEIEKTVLGEHDNFISAMRCAAFCELAYLGKYILRVDKSPQKTLTEFADKRYTCFIGNALKGGENMKKRRDHQQRSVSKQPSLISYFVSNDQAKTRLRNQGARTLNDFNPK